PSPGAGSRCCASWATARRCTRPRRCGPQPARASASSSPWRTTAATGSSRPTCAAWAASRSAPGTSSGWTWTRGRTSSPWPPPPPPPPDQRVTPPARPALRLEGVRFVRDGRAILDGINWTVGPGERWVVLGPNGSGKTTLVRIASMWEHPTSGRVEVGGAVLGRVDVRSHRARIAVVSAAVANSLRPGITAREIVLTARTGALEAWWHRYDDADEARTAAALARFAAGHLADQ